MDGNKNYVALYQVIITIASGISSYDKGFPLLPNDSEINESGKTPLTIRNNNELVTLLFNENNYY